MSTSATSLPPRLAVEQLVRESVYRHLGISQELGECPPNPLVVNVSARHCHLTQETVEQLFGERHQLTPVKCLYQEGFFAAEETVTLIGPRSRVISNLRILGPCRSANQVELSFSDAIALGFDLPVRLSGNMSGTPGCMLMGPNGFSEMAEGVIRAAPHVHMSPDDASYYGVSDGDRMKLRVGGEVGVIFDNIVVRQSPDIRLEVHIDTDEGNACGLGPDSPCVLSR